MKGMKIFLFFILFILISSILVVPASSARKPKYFPVERRKIRDITDFVWPVRITSNSQITINVSTTSGGLEIAFSIPEGFTSRLYFKNAVTGEVYFSYNYSGMGGEGGGLHSYINSTSPCTIGLDGVGTVDIMWFPYYEMYETISSDRNMTSWDAAGITSSFNVPNPAYFKFKIPRDICVYSFSTGGSSDLFKLIDMDESNSTVKTVINEEDNGEGQHLILAFFVFYNRSGGPVHDVKLIDYGAYNDVKSLPAIYGLIPLSIILVAVGVAYYWMKKK